MQPLLTMLHTRQKRLVPLHVVAPERRTVLEHRLRRLLCVVKGIVPRTQRILDECNAAAQMDEHPAVIRLPHPEQDREPPRLSAYRTRRGIDGRQPLREEGDWLFLPCGTQVFFQLRANQADSGSLQGRIEEDEQIVPATVSRNEFQILFERCGRSKGKMTQQHAKEPPLAESPAHVTRVEECAQRIGRMRGKGAREAHDDLRLARLPQRACRRKEVKCV